MAGEQKKDLSKKFLIIGSFLALGFGGLILGMNIPKIQSKLLTAQALNKNKNEAAIFQKLQAEVLPAEGFTLPISWGDLGPKLVEAGVIDLNKFNQIVQPTEDQKNVLVKGTNTPITINSQNQQFVADLMWAIGLAQKSKIYEEGPMGTQYKGQEGTFASTGGWTLAKGDAVKYLGKSDLIPLTPDQQERVAQLSKNIYRPCCDNPTWFPDCNHGMATLAAIELMVSKNLSDDEIYKNVLRLNSFWFGDTYLTTALYFQRQGVSWDKVDAKKVMGKEFSSASGAGDIAKKVGPLPGVQNGGRGCGA